MTKRIKCWLSRDPGNSNVQAWTSEPHLVKGASSRAEWFICNRGGEFDMPCNLGKFGLRPGQKVPVTIELVVKPRKVKKGKA